ncbi:hypothetical protein [uncultured Bacteroides sp.]|uniref:hypothetical protein n=1 Tax=uncultured Bacteroides sp. TaxID=162156 RepID=UPI00259929B6|nr:hypothetical protein [uncultured Bacteroides sp.]
MRNYFIFLIFVSSIALSACGHEETVVQEDADSLETSQELVTDLNDAAFAAFIFPANHRKSNEFDLFNPEGMDYAIAVKQEFDFAQMMSLVQDLDAANEKAKSLFPNVHYCDDLDFLKEYVSNIVEIGDKSQIRLFTDEMCKSIDNAGLSSERTLDLKAMMAIAENSYSLWIIEEK